MRLAFNGDYYISNAFGIYDPVAYGRYPGKRHPGVDFVRPADTPIVAGMSGKVSTIRSAGKTGRGNEVIITNGNKQRKACHLNRIDVKDGQWVEEGQQIGLLGYTGYVVDAQGQVGTPQGAHLHDELLIGGVYVNVMDHLGEEDMYAGKTAQQWAQIANDVTNIAEARLKEIQRIGETVSVKDENIDQIVANIRTQQGRIDQLTGLVGGSSTAADKLEQIKKVLGV